MFLREDTEEDEITLDHVIPLQDKVCNTRFNFSKMYFPDTRMTVYLNYYRCSLRHSPIPSTSRFIVSVVSSRFIRMKKKKDCYKVRGNSLIPIQRATNTPSDTELLMFSLVFDETVVALNRQYK